MIIPPVFVFLKMISYVWIFNLDNLLVISLSSTVFNPLSSHWQATPSQRHTNAYSLSKASSSNRVSTSPPLNSGWWFSGRLRFNSPSGERLPRKEGYLPAHSSREHREVSEDIPGQPGLEGKEVRHTRRRSLTPSPHVVLHWLQGCHSPQVSARTVAMLLMLVHLRIRI